MPHFDRERFLELVDAMPLVSIDLLLEDEHGRFLVGRRRNRPALNTLFVPGGRIMKGESINSALSRIVRKELGGATPIDGWVSYGVFEHFYDDNFAGKSGVTTHYVVLPYHHCLQNGIPFIEPDDQHEEMLWLTINELLDRPDVHMNTKAYFK